MSSNKMVMMLQLERAIIGNEVTMVARRVVHGYIRYIFRANTPRSKARVKKFFCVDEDSEHFKSLSRESKFDCLVIEEASGNFYCIPRTAQYVNTIQELSVVTKVDLEIVKALRARWRAESQQLDLEDEK